MRGQVEKISALGSKAIAAAKSPRGRKTGKWLAIAFTLVGVLGFFVAPPVLKSVLVSQLSQQLHREVSIGDININPYALSTRVTGLSVKAEDGHEVAGFDELYVNLSSASIFKLAAVVDRIRLQGLRLQVAHLGEGRYDISDLLDEWMKPKDEPDTGLPRFSLNNIELIDGKIVFDDKPKGQVHTVEDIQIAVPFVSSLPYQAEVLVQPAFSAVIDGSKLALKGDSKPFSETHESHLKLDLDRFDLTDIRPYLPESLPVRLDAGLFDSELEAVFREVSPQVFSLHIVGSAHVSGFAVSEAGGGALLGWKKLDVDLERIDPLNGDFAIRRVALDAPEATLAVDRKNGLNLQRIADKFVAPAGKRSEPAPVQPGQSAQPAKPVVWSVGEFAIDHGAVHWRDDSNAAPVKADLHDLHVRVGKVESKLAEPIKVSEVSFAVDAGDPLRIEHVALKGTHVDLGKRRVDIAELIGGPARVNLIRDKSGAIAWLTPPTLPGSESPKPEAVAKSKTDAKPAKPKAKPAQAPAEKPWVAHLASLKIDEVGVRFDDQGNRNSGVQEFTGFSLHGENLGNEPGRKGTIALKGRVNQKGSIDIAGSVQAVPVEAALKVQMVAVPLMPLQPYFDDYLNVAVTRGQVSSQGDATLSLAGDKPKASYKGNFTLGDFLAVDRANSTDFLKWKSLYFGDIDFKLEPMAINVGEIALSDFYSRLILNNTGRLNVADIVRKPEGEAGSNAPANAPTKAAEPAKPTPIRIAKVTLQNGTVNFSDYFVKPNYNVNVTKLGGRVTGLSSAENTLADLDLRGSYANSAPVEITAKLNPLATKSYLDLKAVVGGVDLVGFSPYSGKYAGYAIEKGKLSLDVGYKLENRQLTAQNRVFIDQLTFGDKVESPDATTLPVNLAIALLKNNRGEIDVNLPISGSLDDPQFSVGGLIVRVIANLFVKAVTSPFALLGSMFGGGEELSNIEFAPGYASLDAAAVKKLETLAKALNEREALKLEIAGRADPEVDRAGLKQAAVDRAMKAERLKDMTKKGGEGASLDDIVIPPEEYKTYLTRAYKDAKFPKPRNVIGLQKDLPVEDMEKLMLANLPVTEDDIRALAARRAEVVQAWLLDQGKVSAGRVFLVPPKVAVDAENKAKSSRVDFSLK